MYAEVFKRLGNCDQKKVIRVTPSALLLTSVGTILNQTLERIQRQATKWIMNDYYTPYRFCLISLQLLPLIYVYEINDMSLEHSVWATICSWPILPLDKNPTIFYLTTSSAQCWLQSTPHSFRIGAATTAAVAGLPPWLIKTLGRWNSDAYMSYVHAPITMISQVPSILARSSVTDGNLTWNPDEH